jgi:hypothetical protein
MRPYIFALALVLAAAPVAAAETATPQPSVADIGFLVGTWGSGQGKVAETGGSSRGTSKITLEAGGSTLLRRDHTELFGADGKPGGSFDQIMLIYPEGGTLHADYSDGDHIIHYTSAVVVAGKSVSFTSSSPPGAPTFRLTYELTSPDTLTVRFETEPPGQTAFQPIASGTLRKMP